MAMNLNERLMADLRQAMRDGDTPRKQAIRMVRAAIKNAEIEWQREASDKEVMTIIAREVKQRTEALEMFRKAGREELVSEEEAGLLVLDPYLPKQLSQAEIEALVQQIVNELGATGPSQLGQVMRQAMAKLKGEADGRLVNRIARELLSK